MTTPAIVRHADFRQMQIQHEQNNITSIYFFWNEETGLYKIGKSNDPDRRRQELSSIMGMSLCCIFSFKAPTGAEKVIHRFMSPYHHSHECFEDFDLDADAPDLVMTAEDVEAVFADWMNSYGRGTSASACGNNVDKHP